MKKTGLIVAVASVAFAFSCKDEVSKATECTDAMSAYTEASSAYAKDINAENCEALNDAILNYQSKCENLPDGLDTTDCSKAAAIDELTDK